MGTNKEVTESSDAHVTTFNLDVGNFSWHTPAVNHYYFPPLKLSRVLLTQQFDLTDF